MATKPNFKASNPALSILNQAGKEANEAATKAFISESEPKKGIVIDMSKTKKAPRNKRMQIMVTEQTFEKLHDLCEKNNISMNEVINQALESLLAE